WRLRGGAGRRCAGRQDHGRGGGRVLVTVGAAGCPGARPRGADTAWTAPHALRAGTTWRPCHRRSARQAAARGCPAPPARWLPRRARERTRTMATREGGVAPQTLVEGGISWAPRP